MSCCEYRYRSPGTKCMSRSRRKRLVASRLDCNVLVSIPGFSLGRDAAIVEALDSLRGLNDAAPPRLLVILGASGAGKSSFLRAGLLPRLARDDLFLPLPIVRPERAAI